MKGDQILICVTNYEKLKTELLRYKLDRSFFKSNYHLIMEEIKRDSGKYVSFGGWQSGFLVGAAMDDEDFYWVFLNSERKVNFSSCVGRYEVLEGPNSPDFSVLDYIIKNNPEEIKNQVDSYFKEEIDEDYPAILMYRWK